jgi:hypothetical protein
MGQDQATEIASGIRRNLKAIRAAETRWKALALAGFPFDAWLLSLSPLYRRSRRLYHAQGGTFESGLISSPRSLGSAVLLKNHIEYSPVSEELYWAAGARELDRILETRSFCAPVFHEQSHRLLWRLLPPPPGSQGGISRYLNLCEALVVAADMALGDRIGPRLSRLFYLAGATYDPGSPAWQRISRGRSPATARRQYRNYLQRAVLATFLYLELHDPEEIGRSQDPATQRALRLDRQFVHVTNILWQQRHWKKLRQLPGAGSAAALDPAEHWQVYYWAEKWFDLLGI